MSDTKGSPMSGRTGRRVAALMVAGTVAMGAIVVVANAGSSFDAAVANRHEIGTRIVDLHTLRQDRRVAIHKQIKTIQERMDNVLRLGMASNRDRARHFRHEQLKQLSSLRVKERALIRALRARIAALRTQRAEITNWIETLPFQTCPVDGPHEVSDNFGVLRDLPGVPVHIHQGNDIMAATGVPIVAVFDGNAVMEPNDLGGQAVKVYGDAGYVYNAHLSAYGKLGAVQAGDVIGYVGSTGDATAPHDHFEWHPGNGDAVDPYDLLMTVC
jgi:murein DD-endopeptidase MepM/ murein hydrolase activator NlpD